MCVHLASIHLPEKGHQIEKVLVPARGFLITFIRPALPLCRYVGAGIGSLAEAKVTLKAARRRVRVTTTSQVPLTRSLQAGVAGRLGTRVGARVQGLTDLGTRGEAEESGGGGGQLAEVHRLPERPLQFPTHRLSRSLPDFARPLFKYHLPLATE